MRPLSIASMPVLAAITLAAATPSAHAQNALGDGTGLMRPLDATPAQRAAALRPRSFADEVRFRNSIVTGSAPGGLSFRGDVGYTDPFAFRGDLGSNELYEFRRDSIYSGLGGVGIRGTDALQYQFALTTGQTVPSGLARSLTVPRAGTGAFSGQVTQQPTSPDQPTTPTYLRGSPVAQVSNLRSTANFLATRDLQPSLLTTVRDRTGDRFAVISSPLGGIRLEPRTHAELVDPSFRAGDPEDRYAERIERQVRPEDQPNISRAVTPYDALTQRLDDAAPSLRLPDASALPGVTPATRPGDVDEPDPDAIARPGTLPAGDEPADPRPWWQQRIDTLRDELDAAERDAFDALSGDDDDAEVDESEMTPEELEAAARARPVFDAEALRLIREARGDVRSLVPTPDASAIERGEIDPFVVHMEAAQQHMLDRRYFDAEERFTSALAVKPADPTARIGRVHAQIGAGLFLSAGQNLRLLFRQHPELAVLRYDESLMPSAERLDGALESMRVQLGIVGPIANEAALLMAYVGYQRGDDALVQESLAWLGKPSAEDSAGVIVEKVADPLASMLESLWLDPPSQAPATEPDTGE